MTATTTPACTARPFLSRLAVACGIILFFAMLSQAGGPQYVAGTSYFDPAVAGTPLVWPQGQIIYFTDQGDLSPILPNASANSLVADAFSQWTSVPTAALTATNGGQMAEDVNGANLVLDSNGAITAPADIAPSATSKPVGIVYDYDGSVTNALVGAGAGDAGQCFSNAVFGGPDNFGEEAAFQHALVVINGQCAQQSSQLTDVEYRLVRVLGNVLGLGWSQLNLNVVTGHPAATADDRAGFPLMHYTDQLNCVPITLCYASPYQPAMDDVAAVSRLYPVTAGNSGNFPGKQVFSSTTARIHGSVWFTDRSGNPTQSMQGVNVVARWIDPTTHQPSTRQSASSASGFLFTGNAGNPITGFNDLLGNPYSNWGSNDPSVEGFFDLAGLEFPNGATSAQYQLSVEGLDPVWSEGVGPYAPYQTAPSGAPAPIVVTVAPGVDIQQDILMLGSAQPVRPWAASKTWATPAPVPPAGDWMGSLSGYGDADYFFLSAQANRTFSVAVTTLDENQLATTSKARPLIGIWSLSDPQGTLPPALTPGPFNTGMLGTTRLDAQVLSQASFRIGISDVRGDGRPDYRYHARVLYADTVLPSRISVNGGAVTLLGLGFTPGLTVRVGGTNVTPMATSASRMVFTVPAQSDGAQDLTITDPATGAYSTMTGALQFGASSTDNLVLVQKTNPPTPVGTQAAQPVVVQVVASDNITPVSGATIGWSATNGAALSACGGASSCTAITDDSGLASTWATPTAVGTATITATLAPGAFSTPKSVSAPLSATSSSSDINVLTPKVWIPQGANLSFPVTARVVSNGIPQSGATVNFAVLLGSATLSAGSAQTNSSGYASVNVTLSQFSTNLQVNACVGPGNAPCQASYAFPVPAAQLQLMPVAGEAQAITLGQAFQPLTLQVTDSSSPPNPVLGASVAFQVTVLRPAGNSPLTGPGDGGPGNPAMPIILSVTQTTVLSDGNGLASIVPATGSFAGPLEVDIFAAAGANAAFACVLEAWPGTMTYESPPKPPPGSSRNPFRLPPVWPADVAGR
jgi:hypothetical protein